MVSLIEQLSIPNHSDFSIHNIPFGCCSYKGREFVSTRIGNYIIDLSKLSKYCCLIPQEHISVFDSNRLNLFIKLGKKHTTQCRKNIIKYLKNTDNDNTLFTNEVFIDSKKVVMLMPVQIGDYTDFYSSIEHATNVGELFRDPKNALNENWLHMPIAYHGRASSISLSGLEFKRPKGQIKVGNKAPKMSKTNALDFELEMAFITFDGKPLGDSITTQEAEEYIFGMCIFNDWSARDIQRWEYIPLGPFLGKNFASVLSPWIVTLEALNDFRVKGPKQKNVLEYLQYSGNRNYDIHLELDIKPNNETNTYTICKSNYKHLYWNMAQQLAHHTVNGCNIRAGDLMASGTISGKDKKSLGSMLEITKMGKEPITLPNKTKRNYIEDGDEVIIRAFCLSEDKRVGFGVASSKVAMT